MRLVLLATLSLAVALASVPARASQRTFVASYGQDTNTCALTQPCRSLGQAVTQTDAGGEILVLDPAGYGPVTIAQSLSIIAPAGVYAGVAVFSGAGVSITGTGIDVAPCGLDINGQGGTTGINVLASASRVVVERTTVSRMASYGVYIGTASRVTLKDVVVRRGGGVGIKVLSASGPARVYAERVTVEDNDASGLYVDNSAYIEVADSAFVRNGMHGIEIFPDSRETVRAVVAGSACTGNAVRCLWAQGGGISEIVLGRNVIMHNAYSGVGTAPSVPGAVYLYSRADNIVTSNGANPEATPVIIAPW